MAEQSLRGFLKADEKNTTFTAKLKKNINKKKVSR